MRLFTDGAEFGDLLFWDAFTGTPSASSAQKRSGSYSYRSPTYGCYLRKYFTSSSEVYGRFAFRLDTVASTGHLLQLWSNSGSFREASIIYNHTTGAIQVLRSDSLGSVLLQCSGVPIAANTWYLLEFHYLVDDVNGKIDIKIDGVPVGSFTGDTKGSTYTQLDAFVVTEQGIQFYIDDIALNNTDNSDGLNDTSWCGDGHVEILKPNDNGALNQWVGQDSDSTDNYQNVNDFPSDGDTTYNESLTPGDQDMYAMTDFDGTGKTILRVYPEARARDTVPEGAQVKLGIRTGGTNYLSSAITLASGYGRIVGEQYKINPGTSSAWTDSDLDAIQFVVETV